MMKKSITFLLVLTVTAGIFVQTAKADVTKTVGATGANFTTLKLAFDAVNANTGGVYTGAITLQIIDNTTEAATAVLNSSANWTSLIIYPTVTGKTISITIAAAPLIDLDGADNVTIDGRLYTAGVPGSSANLTITNASTSIFAATSTIRFINGATSNTVKYCNIKGSETMINSGVIFFSRGASNNDNIIEYNKITSCTAGTRPANAIFSRNDDFVNTGCIIRNNDIFDFLNRDRESMGIFLNAGSSGFTISGNSFYETTSFAPTGTFTYYAIRLLGDHVVTGNFIGGNSSSATGTWTKTASNDNIFYGIYGSGGVSIQNNTIRNIAWSNSGNAAWYGMYIYSGLGNIGNETGNTIGSSTGTGSITVTGGATGVNVYGIYFHAPNSTFNCQNNTIGSIIAANSNGNYSSNFYGIYRAAYTGTTTISNNLIGSTTQANSIYASSISYFYGQDVIGISNAGTGTITISGNTIANLTNSTENSSGTLGRINGITSVDGTNTISNNSIHDLNIASSNGLSTYQASVIGIALDGTTTTKTVTGNTIYNLYNNCPTSFVGQVIGLVFNGSTGANIIANNFIHNLYVHTLATGARISGIRINSGSGTYSNNIISLWDTPSSAIFGIFENAGADNNNSFYFNTIYIGGEASAGTYNSHALYSTGASNTRIFMNNIFANVRSNTVASVRKHYGLYITATGGTITCDNNDYYVTGTGGVLGYYGADKSSLPIVTGVTGNDANSQAINPAFHDAGNTSAADYLPSAPILVAVTGTGISTDYDGTTRSLSLPAMGAHEYTVTNTLEWTGNTDSDWNVANNWNPVVVPTALFNVYIPSGPALQPVVYQSPGTPAVCKDLSIQNTAKLLISPGKALTVVGSITNSAGNTGLVIRSDASGTGSLIHSTADVPGTMERYIAAATWNIWDDGWHNLSSPVANQVISPEFVHGFDLGTEDFYKWDETTNTWINIKNDGATTWTDGFETSFVVGRGYLVAYAANVTKKFIGNLNVADVPVSNLTLSSGANRSWNLLGNPFASALTWYTGWTTTNIGGVANIWNEAGSSYTPVNAGDPIPAGNGFMVEVSSGTGSLTIPAAKRTHNVQGWYKNSTYPVVQLFAHNLDDSSFQESQVRFNPEATTGFDLEFDGNFLPGYAPLFYSVMEGEDFMVNSLPVITEATVIPFTFIKNEGTNFSIEATGLESFEQTATIYLRDSKLGINHNLSENPVYTFTSFAGDTPERWGELNL